MPLLHTTWGDFSGRVSSASGWKSLGIYKAEMIALIQDISDESLLWLYSGKFLSTRLSALLWERRELNPLIPNTVKLVRKDREKKYISEERGVTGYISIAQRLECTPLSGKVNAFAFYPMLISCKIHSEIYFFKEEWKRGLSILQEYTLCIWFQNKEEMFYGIIIEKSMIRQAEKDRKRQTGRNIKEKARELASS